MPQEFNVTTGAGLISQDANNQVKLWEAGARIAEYEADIMMRFEGGDNAPIVAKTLPQAAGTTIVFRNRGKLGADGVRGDELVSDTPGPEGVTMSGFAVKLDYLRHAVKTNLRGGLVTGLGKELNEKLNLALGEWLGWKKSNDALMAFLKRGNAENYKFAGGKYSREALRSADTITYSSISVFAQQLKTLGAQPAFVRIDRNSKRELHGFWFLGLGESFLGLKNSSAYIDAVEQAAARGPENPRFTGELVKIDNNVLVEWNPPDHADPRAIGSPLNPKALLGEAITPGTTAFDIKGGGNPTFAALTNHKYFESFSNYQYRFGTESGETVPPDSTTRYVLIYNTSGPDEGKMGFYSYQVNNGNKLTVTGRLGSAASGIRNTTIGNVTWNTGPWAGRHTDQHPVGSLVIETNSYGVPIGRVLIMGNRAMCRAYSSLERVKRAEEITEGGFLHTTWIRSIFGQAPFRRLDQRCPNFLVVETALSYAGLSLPTIT